MLSDTQNTIPQFLTFIQRSQDILAQRAGSYSPVKSFQQFIAAATPLVLPRLKSSLPMLIEKANLVRRWLTSHNILAVAGLSYAENPYTELLAWLLEPRTHDLTGIRRQTAWLRVLGIADRIEFSRSPSPQTQFRTDDGICDLILEYPNDLLIVEVKTETVEHVAPSGSPQTLAYAGSVPKRLGLKNKKRYVVFLTPGGDKAENATAIATTFGEFVVALATELAPEELPPDLQWAFSTIFTHLLTYTAPDGVDIHSLLAQVVHWESDKTLLENETFLMTQLKPIQQATQLLLPESRS